MTEILLKFEFIIMKTSIEMLWFVLVYRNNSSNHRSIVISKNVLFSIFKIFNLKIDCFI